MLFKRWFNRHQSTNRPTPLSGKRLVLDELRNALSAQLNSADDLDDKLKQLLNSASLILALVTTLQITRSIEHIGWPYLTAMSIAFILYAILIIQTISGLRPSNYYIPISFSWDEIAHRYFHLNEADALSLLISTYLKTLPKNAKRLSRKSKAVRNASTLLVLLVIALLCMGLFGLSDNVIWPWQ